MKISNFVVFLGAIAIGGLVLWWMNYSDQTDDDHVTQQGGAKRTDATVQQAAMQEAMQKLAQAKEAGDEKAEHSAVQSFAKAIGGKVGGMLGMANSTVGAVHFYGRVIDQHGQGVAGARVDLVIGGGGYMAPGSGLNYAMTDAEGYFEVKGKGSGVSILDIKHQDVADVYYRDRDGKKKQGAHYQATNQYGEKYNWNSYADKRNPLKINVWRVEKFEKVKVGYGTAFHPTPDGRISKNSTRGGIVATCMRDVKIQNAHWQEQKGSWSITFRPIGGGIQETDDLYLNEAPLDGYRSELTVAMQQGSPDYKVRIYPARHYYYYFVKDGENIYGSMEATFEPYMYDDECRVPIKYKYSLSGSRNLAVQSRM